MTEPDRPPLDPDLAREVAGYPWARLVVTAATPSTNADLLEAEATLPAGTVLVAEHQVAGRGRRDRHWISPPRAGLTFSVLLRPPVPPARWGWLPLLAGLAVCDGVRQRCPDAGATLKWPNDLLVGRDRCKAGGILVQTSRHTAVIGIGVNVSTTRAELPVDGATSLELASAGRVDRSRLLGAILGFLGERFDAWVEAAGDAGRSRIKADYRAACTTLGRTVSVTPSAGEPWTGLATDVDDDGRLLVLGETGPEVVAAADVLHVRLPTG